MSSLYNLLANAVSQFRYSAGGSDTSYQQQLKLHIVFPVPLWSLPKRRESIEKNVLCYWWEWFMHDDLSLCSKKAGNIWYNDVCSSVQSKWVSWARITPYNNQPLRWLACHFCINVCNYTVSISIRLIYILVFSAVEPADRREGVILSSASQILPNRR